MARKTKRTAGQRRYLVLKRKADSVRGELTYFRDAVVEADNKEQAYKPAYIVKKLTEAIERLKNHE